MLIFSVPFLWMVFKQGLYNACFLLLWIETPDNLGRRVEVLVTVQLVYNFRSCSLVFWWKEVSKNSEFTVLWMISFFNVGKSCACVLNHFSHVWLFETLGTIAHHAPLYMDSTDKNTGVGCHALHQGRFPNQGSNLHLISCIGRQVLYHWGHLGSPKSCRLNLRMSVTNWL